MTWANSKELGEKWAESVFPIAELKGHTVQLASFDDEATCRFFFPDWSRDFHRMVTSAAARRLRKAGGKTRYQTVTLEAYRAWLKGKEHNVDSMAAYLKTVQVVLN